MLKRLRRNYYRRLLGREAGDAFTDLECLLLPPPHGPSEVAKMLDWIHPMTPEDRLNAIRAKEMSLDLFARREPAVAWITHKNRLMIKLERSKDKAQNTELSPEERSELVGEIERTEPKFVAAVSQVEEIKAEILAVETELTSILLELRPKYGQMPRRPTV